jgi:DNA-binding GntR family transcriptional regulator
MLARPSTAELLAAELRREILDGDPASGERLRERELVERYGVARHTLRAALRQLAGEGLVRIEPHRGATVARLGPEDIRDLYELREALEAQSARLFTQRATPAQRLEVRRQAEQVDVLFNRLSTGAHDPAFGFAVHSHHVDFHLRVAEHSGSRLIKQIIERKHVLILNWLLDVAARRTPLPPGFHSTLAEALISGDPERADEAMRAHVRYGFTEIAGKIGALAGSEWRERRRGHPKASETGR